MSPTLASIIGTKAEMTQVYTTDGKRFPVTRIKAGPCRVVQIKTQEKDGYVAVQLAYGSKKRITNPVKGHLKKHGVKSNFRIVREFDVDENSGLTAGDTIKVETVFAPGDIVKVAGVSKGKGFAGGVKRYGFSGGPKTHGQSDRHRAPGSIGAGTTPGRVYKGKKMAGHLGDAKVTIFNLIVLDVNQENGTLLLSGSIPGARNSVVTLTKIGHTDKILPVIGAVQPGDAVAETEEAATTEESTA